MKSRQTVFWMVTGLLIAASAPHANAFTDCYRSCMDASGCWSSRSDENVSYCSGVQADCSTRCRNEASGGGGSYGAIAYDVKSGASGYSHGWTNQKKAELIALKYCRENGKHCKPVVWFSGSCGAVASDGKHAFWGTGSNTRAAMNQAMNQCGKSWFHGRCEEKVWHCSE